MESEVSREPLISAGASELLVHQKPAYSDHPVDYFVPHFGQDIDIKASLSNTKGEEKRLKHEISFWKEDLPKDVDHPMNYVVPNYGVDEDIKSTTKNIADASASLQQDWVVPKDGY